MHATPPRTPRFAPAEIEVTHRADGSLVLRSPRALAPHPTSLGRVLRDRAERDPEAIFLAERAPAGEGWRRLSYAAVHAAARALGQALLDRGLGPERPLMILSDNGADHALLALAAQYVGVPAAPVSAAYSLQSQDFAKLRYVFDALTPGLVFAEDGAAYARALRALPLRDDVEVVVSRNAPDGVRATLLEALAATRATDAVDDALARVGGETIAKVLFTSGSTGMPKGVVNTHGMLCANQQALAQGWPFLAERPPVAVDWLPWSHTFGGNHNFNMLLWHGGTLYIDRGKPTPALIGETVRALAEVAPTVYFNVPRGFGALVPFLEQDSALRANFFRDLDLLFYAAAALPQPLWDRLTELSVRARGAPVPFVSAWGSTETSPLVTQVHFPLDRPGVIGLPVAGTALKMVPNGGKLELRVKGPSVTVGYWRDAALSRAAFDDEGFYRIGDAGKLLDPSDPRRGVVFDGRIAEDFKLSSGTWVHVGALRLAAIAAGAPVVQDVVVAGHDRDEVGVLVFLDRAACAALVPGGAALELRELCRAEQVRRHVAAGLAAYNGRGTGQSSTRIARALLLEEPPSIDANEITDKGYINQGAVLERRAARVAQLYAGGDAEAIVVG